MRYRWWTFIAFIGIPNLVSAQRSLQVDVVVASVQLRGDTVGIAHIVHNSRSSKDSLSTFLVDAKTGVLRMQRPEPRRNWAAFQDFSGRPMVNWGVLQLLLPDSTTPPLYYESIGIPGIATYWVDGNDHPAGGENEEPDPNKPAIDPLVTEMISGHTVGVEAWPTDRTSRGLLVRLRGLTEQSCVPPLSWITSSALCETLKNDLDLVQRHMPTDRARAKQYLSEYIVHLGGSKAGTFADGVSSSAYWLLKPNAEIILGAL
jgi:hypothetical protein